MLAEALLLGTGGLLLAADRGGALLKPVAIAPVDLELAVEQLMARTRHFAS